MSSSPNILVSGIAHLGGKLLFDSLTLRLRPGEWTALLGPSGSGKSTLLRLIAGLPVAAEFEGQIKADDQQSLNGRIGYMAQQDLLLEWATIRENVALGGRLRGEGYRQTGWLILLLRSGWKIRLKTAHASYQAVSVSVLH